MCQDESLETVKGLLAEVLREKDGLVERLNAMQVLRLYIPNAYWAQAGSAVFFEHIENVPAPPEEGEDTRWTSGPRMQERPLTDPTRAGANRGGGRPGGQGSPQSRVDGGEGTLSRTLEQGPFPNSHMLPSFWLPTVLSSAPIFLASSREHPTTLMTTTLPDPFPRAALRPARAVSLPVHSHQTRIHPAAPRR